MLLNSPTSYTSSSIYVNTKLFAYPSLSIVKFLGFNGEELGTISVVEGEDVPADDGLVCASDPQAVCWAHAAIEFTYAHGCRLETQ